MLALFIMGWTGVLALHSPLKAQDYTKSDAPLISYDTQHHPKLAEHGMVVAQEEYAAKAGRDILAKGGNAVDAAVATGFALAVTHPQAGNLGGGGFMLVYLAAENRTIALDYREMAPQKAHRDMFLNEQGEVDNQQARFSLRSTAVPGTVLGLTEAHKAYGQLPLSDVMAPAIRMASEGFAMTWPLYESLRRYEARLKADPVSARLFFKEDGSLYRVGEVFKQELLGKTLKEIAAHGADGFYKGWVADALVKTVSEGGGLINHEDLAAYRMIEREAAAGHYHGYDVVAMPPPSSGGVHVIQMLNILEGVDLKGMGHNSAAYIHHLVEAMKYAYADRSKYLGDPDFFPVPVKALTSKEYGAALRSKIDPERAKPSTDIAPAPVLLDESPDTTHFSVMDNMGNMVSNTYTLNFTYGNGKSVAGAGFLLNNEMDDFSAKPGVPNAFGLLGGEANAIAPGKRPLSSMTPLLLLKDGKPLMATGSPGGSTIITVVLQMALNVMDFDMNPAAATSAPRIHHQWFPDKLLLEPGHSVDTRRFLKAMGHNVSVEPVDQAARVLGSTQTVMRAPNGLFWGAADPRRPGSFAAGY